MKIRALKKFEGIKDLERDVFPKEGEVWEASEERAEFLKSHGVIEIVDEIIEESHEEEKPVKKSKKKNKKASE